MEKKQNKILPAVRFPIITGAPGYWDLSLRSSDRLLGDFHIHVAPRNEAELRNSDVVFVPKNKKKH